MTLAKLTAILAFTMLGSVGLCGLGVMVGIERIGRFFFLPGTVLFWLSLFSLIVVGIIGIGHSIYRLFSKRRESPPALLVHPPDGRDANEKETDKENP
jgi:hypothetical protein